jgi:MFS family permease
MVSTTPSVRRPARVHRAWWVALATLAALVSAAMFRSSVGVMLEPLEAEFGWSRATTSGAVSLSLLLYGLAAPFGAALMERFGIRRVAVGALLLISAGSVLTLAMTARWQLWVLWGGFVGTGTGCLALVFGAMVAQRWFVRHRGLVMGVFSASTATGQLLFLPVIARLAEGPGWRYSAGLIALTAAVLVPVVWLAIRDDPREVGATPYGAPADWTPPAETRRRGAARAAMDELARSSRSGVFWVLAATFWVCGWSTNGLIGTHFVPAAHDHGMPATTSASLLALIGVFDIVGTIASGWLTDRVDPRHLLFGYYLFRGISLLAVSSLLAPTVEPALLLFVVFYGLDWVATVPPTVALCRQHFGLERAGVVFGWVFAAHMVGAAVAASFAGWVRTSQGDYLAAWVTAGALCLAAAVACLVLPPAPTRDDRPAT